jgi:DNA repair exonuclease SbcCD nuclease subunit
MAFSFVHTGDLHLDSPFVGLTTAAPPTVAALLRESTILAWRNIVDLALAEQVDFLVVAGDAFERANRTLRGQLEFRDGLARLAQAGIASFVVTGNHDPLDGWEPSVTWPELAHRFGAHDGTEIARVYGISYHQRDISANLARHFRRDAEAPYAIGLLHANVGGLEGHANYAPCTLADLKASGMDYWALGHIHKHAVLSKKQPTAVYCGNPQGRDPGETDPRGCYLVRVDDAGRTHPAFHPVDVVRWQLLDVPIAELETEEALVDAVTTAVDAARSGADRSIVARVTLTGRGPMHASLARPGLRDDLRTTAQERLGTSEPFAWIEGLRDATRPALDIEARRKTEDFVGDLLRRLDAARSALRQTAEGTDADHLSTDADHEGTEADQESTGAEGTDATDATGAPATPVEGVPSQADLEKAIEDLFGNQRARRVLAPTRPDAERIAALLDEAEAILVDRLGDEG